MSDSKEPGVVNEPDGNSEDAVPADGVAGAKKSRDNLSAILKNYKKDPKQYDSKVRIKIDDYIHNTKDVQLPQEWKDFTRDMVKETVDSNPDLCRYLIDFAQQLDDRYDNADMKDSSLYESIIKSYPKAIALNDIEKYYSKSVVSDASFDRFCNRAKDHIKAATDGKFAIELFDWLKTLNDNEKVATYLYAVLSDKDVAANVLNEKFFEDKNKVGEDFANDIKQFARENKKIPFKYESTVVWQNWLAVKKRKKRRAVIITVSIFCVIAVIIGAAAGIYAWWNSIKESTISIEGRGIIYCTYGESPDVDGYSITYKKNSGEEVTIPVTSDMLSYDSETIGQQEATISYNGKTLSVTLEISAADIDVPVLTQSGNSISWKSVEHAKEYNLYITQSSTAVADTEYATTTATSYDLSTHSDLSGTFYVYVIAVSESDKYNNSVKSDSMQLEKLASITSSSVTYVNGYITWDKVEGADHYMLTYNGISVQNIKTTSYEVELSGDITISINAYSADSSVISSAGSEITLTKLSKVTSAEYSEIAGADGSTTSRISWTASEECYYIYSIDGGDYSTTAQLANYIDVSDMEAGVHTVSIICYPMYSGQVQSDAVTYKFSINSAISVSSDGIVSWDKIGSTYAVYIDGTLSRNGLSVESFSLDSDNLAAGNHTITIVADGDIYGKTLTFTQLAVPALSVVGGTTLSASGATAYTVYKCNGVEYTDIDELSAAISAASGEYEVTAQNISTSANIISSSSASVTITKLAPPVLYVHGGEIVSASSALQFYEGTNRVSIDDLTVGSHTLTAKALGTGNYVLYSEMSESITVTKLSAPVLSYDSSTATLSVVNELSYTIKYYIDGEAYSGTVANLVNSLSSGSHEITARYIGDDTSVISSSESNTITILQTNTKISVSDNGNQVALVRLTNMEEGLVYSITVYFYDEEGNQIDTMTKEGETADYQTIQCKRAGKGNAYSVMVIITFTTQDADAGSSTYTLSGTTTISWN